MADIQELERIEARLKRFIDVENIKANLEKYHKRLKLLARDTQREKDRIEQIYTIDYLEIDTYIHERNQYGIVRSVIDDSPNQKFILLSGAVRELLSRLGLTAKGFQDLIKKLHFGRLRELDELKRFIEVFDKENDPIKIISSYNEMCIKFPFTNFLQSRFIIEPSLKRLISLIENRVLISPVDMGIDLSKVEIDNKLYNQIFQELNSLRYKSYSNKIDTQNFVLTYALNEAYYQVDKRYFTHLTHSHIPILVYKNIDWKNDPLKKNYPNEILSIFRTPIECWNATKIKKVYRDILDREEYLRRGIELCRQSIDSLFCIEEYKETKDEIERRKKRLRELQEIKELTEQDLKVIEGRLNEYSRKIENIRGAIYQPRREPENIVSKIGRVATFNFREFQYNYYQNLEYAQKGKGEFEVKKQEIIERIRRLLEDIRSEQYVLNQLQDEYERIKKEIKKLWEILQNFKKSFVFEEKEEFDLIEKQLRDLRII